MIVGNRLHGSKPFLSGGITDASREQYQIAGRERSIHRPSPKRRCFSNVAVQTRSRKDMLAESRRLGRDPLHFLAGIAHPTLGSGGQPVSRPLRTCDQLVVNL